MRRRDFLGAAALAPTVVRAQDFEEYRRQQQAGMEASGESFEAYKERVRAAFDDYRRQHEAAFRAFQDRVQSVWQRPEFTDRHKWVEYRDGVSVQRVVDFQGNQIRLKLPAGSEAGRARAELTDLLLEDEQTAFQRDPVSRQVEESVDGLPVDVERGSPGKEKILGGLFSRPRPERADAERKAASLLEGASDGREPVKDEQGGDAWATTLTIPMPEGTALEQALDYRPRARELASEWDIGESLILAVAHTESTFNPRARSHIPAYGLMQIVPESAGRDASAELFGEPRVLAPSYLYEAGKNLRIGAIYLHILYHRYLASIRDRESRLYCAIAAYNTGAGNVARVFTGNTSVEAAAAALENRPAGEVYHALVEGLPHAETREYLPRVVRRLKAYRNS
jgi:membrane-bound lytic murein transglycosylase C